LGQDRKKRMTLPKKREDIERVVKEVEEHHPPSHHEHHHHHHEAGGLEDVLTAFEYILDSMNANLNNLEDAVNRLTIEVSTLYKVLSKVVRALSTEDPQRRQAELLDALSLLDEGS